jgi:hypothetical protein
VIVDVGMGESWERRQEAEIAAARRARNSATLVHLGCPPSFNQIGFRSHWAKGQRVKKEWQDIIWALLLAAKVPRPLATCTVTASLRFPTRHRRDEGNYRTILEKACGDALQLGWLLDDTPDFYSFGALTFEPERGRHRTTLHLEWTR